MTAESGTAGWPAEAANKASSKTAVSHGVSAIDFGRRYLEIN